MASKPAVRGVKKPTARVGVTKTDSQPLHSDDISNKDTKMEKGENDRGSGRVKVARFVDPHVAARNR